MLKLGTIVFTSLLLATVSPASAEDWIADRLRGQVEIFADGDWTPLVRGDSIQDAAKVRTASAGRVEFHRGEETISLGGNTEIILNQVETQRMTRIVQVWGTVTVEAEKRNVQHFSVQTPVMAAIVKGTQFTVTYRNGLTKVDVEEGIVEIRDFATNTSVDLRPGQSAAASQMRPVKVSGPGSEDVIYVIDGQAVAAAAREAAFERRANRQMQDNASANGVEHRASPNVSNPGQSTERRAGASDGRNQAADNAASNGASGAAANRPSGGQGSQSAQSGHGNGRP
ncbi:MULTISPECIES: FecR family protein [Devosia]|uniref:FecR family protein n=1 Tax=Devosia TaxID=46913 RepID=UPI000CE944D0|nr:MULTISPECIES: FecR family protein [Devosia]AVF02403.1 hypothetical protein C4375_00775 [Devosia sp. I507]